MTITKSQEIKQLKEQLKQTQFLTDSLVKLWDNEYDDCWNDY